MKRLVAALSFSLLTVAPAFASAAPGRQVTPHQPTTEEVLAQPRDGTRLLLQAGLYDPTKESLDFAAVGLPRARDLETLPAKSGPSVDYAIVQFRPGQHRAAEECARLGVELFGYFPDNAFVVRLDAAARARLAGQPYVRWIGDYEPGFKVSPRLWPGTRELRGELVVHVFPGVSLDAVYASLSARFPGILRTSRFDDAVSPSQQIAVPHHVRDAFVVAASQIDGLRWIEPYDEPRLHNIDSSGPIQGNVAGDAGRRLFARGITGTGQIAAVADSGLDSDMCFFRNLNGVNEVTLFTDTPNGSLGPLFPNRKVVAYWVQPGADAYDNNEICTDTPTGFHGTHTSGSVVGDNPATPSTPSNPGIDDGDGMAPNAQLLFQDVGNAAGCLVGLQDRGAMYAQALAGGARVHSNSYGSDSGGLYTSSDQSTDRFLFDHDEMTIVFSAGNAGPGARTIGSPGVAKNVITVGALSHGNTTAVARFSSRGPTQDGRIKPDVTAPGTDIRSAGGNVTQGDNNCGLSQLSGTSMAAPTAAGAAVLLRQYFSDGFYPTGAPNPNDALNANAALVKAVLLNGTLPLPAGRTFGDFAYGWGRVFLDNNLFFPGDDRKLRVWSVPGAQGLRTGELSEYTVAVRAGSELRVTLVWSDPEGSLGAAVALVNDLDLSVVDSTGATLRGNSFNTAGESVAGTTADHTNNVEQVRLTAPAEGTWTIRIAGTNVPGNGRSSTNRQGYAVVVSAGGCDSVVTATPASISGSSNPTMGVDLAFTSAPGSKATQVYRANGTCSVPAADFQYVGRTASASFTDPRAQGGLTYSYKLRGIDECGEGPVSSCVTVSPTGLCDVAPTFSGIGSATANSNNCQIDLQWSAATANCPLGTTVRYNVYRSTSPDLANAFAAPYATVTGATSFSDIKVSSGVTYYYVVRAEDSVNGATGPNGGNEEKNLVYKFATAFGSPGATGTWTDDGGDTNAYLTIEAPWQLTATQAQAGLRSYHSASDDGVYPSDTCASVVTPTLTLDSGAQLSYSARFNLEFQWDGVVVEISADGGSSWSDLPPSGGYPSTLSQTLNPPVNACGYPATRGAFTGPASNGALTPWTSYSSSLAAFAGSAVKIRWRLTTDPGAAFDGFFLDSISITNVRLPSPCVPVVVVPVASFAFTPRAAVANIPVTFTDTSANEPASWSWDFGDGSSSTEKNPTHVYTTAGLRVVKLTVANAAGSNQTTREITIGDPSATYSAQLILPGQARAQGAGSSFFRTSMWLTNPGAAESIVRLKYVPTGANGGAEESVLVTIPSNRSVAFADILSDAFGASTNTAGAIVVEVASGKATPIVTSRTFNDAGIKGTFGQYIPAISLSSAAGGEVLIEGLGGDAANRSNVGVLNLTETSINATITVRDADGFARGNPVPIAVPARSAVQVNGVNTAAGAGAMPLFGVRVTGTGSFFSYASKLDNKTSDPIFIPGTLAPRSAQWIDGVGSLVGANNTLFKSNLSLTNRNASDSAVTITLTPRGAVASTASTTVTLPASTTKFYNDAVSELFNFQGAGSLKLTAGSATPVVGWARTYSDQGAAGTLGQFIPAFAAEELIGTGGAIIQGLSQNSRYRTNAGFVNTGTSPVSVTVSVWRPDGSRAGEKVYTPAAGQSVFISQIIRDITGADVTDAYLRVVPAAGGAIYAWASFVDNVSTDQTFVRPIPIP
jgi:PKD repeat protein